MFYIMMVSNEGKVSRPSQSMHYVLSEQEEQTTLLAKKHKISRPSSSMTSVIDEKEPTTLVAKKHKVSCPCGSMAAIFEDLKPHQALSNSISTQTRWLIIYIIYYISMCQNELALLYSNLYLIIGFTNKKKMGPTKCLKTHGLRYEDRLTSRLNAHGQPIGSYRATLSNYQGTLARNAYLIPLTFTSCKGLKENWDDLWKTVIVLHSTHLYH